MLGRALHRRRSYPYFSGLIEAAADLLVLGLGRGHPEYPYLRSAVTVFNKIREDNAVYWVSFVRNHALKWRHQAYTWLRTLVTHLERTVEKGGTRRRRTRTTPVHPSTLSQLLGSLGLSDDARQQAFAVTRSVSLPNLLDGSYHDLGLSMDTDGICTTRARFFLNALAVGECKNNQTTMANYLAAIRAVVCDSEELLSSLAAAVERQMLATLATRMQRICSLQDEVRDRLRLLPYDRSAWWQLYRERCAAREAVGLAFVTFPAAQDTVAHIREAMARLDAQTEPLMDERGFSEAYGRFRSEALAGWERRLGLDGGRQQYGHPEELETTESRETEEKGEEKAKRETA
ncbi:hypothetical protein NEMBOFW57_007084 [Staphylotrichum longicolle]|uniref:Uncharacterized protein n=1 Tax=Staphylotrichum longicolle TaxID=669026 RepID=A0AAD4EXP7_9PEZI|nr:hypothetical protein NEMBOFW57_007084 [Staphylotrichum longicolle]